MLHFCVVFVFLLTASISAAETTVRIAGTTRKNESQVLELMAGRLEHVRNHDASPSRADDAAFLVRQVMQKDGYAAVTVDWRIVSRNEIILTVVENGRLELGQVTLTGVPPEEADRLAKLYARPARKDYPLVTDSAPYREKDEAQGLAYIRQDLNAQGYWNAEVTVSKRQPYPDSGQMNPFIAVHPGVRHTIGVASISGPDAAAIGSVRDLVAPYVGKKATTANLNAMRLAVEQSFSSNGYSDAKITMGRTLESAQFIPDFFIDLGKRVRLRELQIEGLKRTDPDRIARRMEVLKGEWYDEAAMNKRVRGLLATGAFTSVRVDKVPVMDGSVDATLHFKEAKAREFSVAVGADSYQGGILRLTYADRNLLGYIMGFSSGFEFSARGVLGETKLTDPWLFGSDVAATARAYALFYGREGYTALEAGLEGKLNWKSGDHYSLEFLAANSVVNLAADGLPSPALGETVYAHPRIRVTQSLDFRDSAVLPKSGWHFENPVELGAALGDVSAGYLKTGLTGGWYHALGRHYDIGVGGEVGVVVPSGDGGNLPIDLRLFNGGARSVRSFPERDLGPSLEGYPLGGEAMWNSNVELIRNLTGSLNAVAFLDAGMLSRDFSSLGSGHVEVAAGIGLRLDLPIGPVRLEYGYNLTRDAEEPVGTLNFAIGVAY
jgi:outer membrane protein insertion porin family